VTWTRIQETFAARRAEGRKVLIAYLTVGYPNLESSLACALAALDAGADVLELGVPFSDPSADGPVIAKASYEAIAQGGSLRSALGVLREIRKERAEPVILFSYYNPVLAFGEGALPEALVQAGGDGLLVVDLPPEEGALLRTSMRAESLAVIPLLAPTSGPEREKVAVAQAHGFIYYVSVAGVTGSGVAPLAAAGEHARKLEEQYKLPVVVGFGVGTPEQARLASAGGASGVVVGTAIIRAIGSSPRGQEAEAVRALISSLRAALDAPR
jgi:tryptophan synthase alpha chain